MRISDVIGRLLDNFPWADPVHSYGGRKISRLRMIELKEAAAVAEARDDEPALAAISKEIGFQDPWS